MTIQPTQVTFPSGSLREDAVVLASERAAGGWVVVTDVTPFHPVDHTWPDQPGDTGTLTTASGARVAVTDTLMAATEDGGSIVVGADLPVRRGTDGWTWLVAHRTTEPIEPGTVVTAVVDEQRRFALSRGHTACHLASLALDAALADLWRKDPGADALGSPDFEGRANTTSQIRLDGSVDAYRLGKSLRKAGFATERLIASLAEREQRINDRLATWVASGAQSWIAADGAHITDRRWWHCALPEGEAVIPCGGTHADSLAAFAAVSVRLELPDAQTLVMTTTARPRLG